jgi:hypothetical protein
MSSKFYTCEEVAAYLGYSPKYVNDFASFGSSIL